MSTLHTSDPGSKDEENPRSAARGPNLSRRKVPQQRRSRSTVDSIKQAAMLLLSEHGLVHCTTEHIAERAGVSIGSLYQYFPNRDTILIALYEDASIQYAGDLQVMIPQFVDMPIKQATERAVKHFLTTHERHGLALLQLVNEAPHLHLAERPLSFLSLVSTSARAYVVNRLGYTDPREMERRAFFMKHIIIGCINAYLRESPARISRKEFITDLAAIMTNYLEPLEASSSNHTRPQQ